ncbi:DUF3606 domain-containing protein [Chryseobacterium sp.]|uniref:DUF3606 domain-containing protein n=1 Tax=Chryseobacterium sp. TaxID=1871047 RepID=UPI0023F3F711|nr:DUF3606 domain-containing protein [Chryseobacterium sp.]
MSDDLSKRRPQDATKINVNESWELELGVTKELLKEAVRAVGTSVEDVKRYLGK